MERVAKKGYQVIRRLNIIAMIICVCMLTGCSARGIGLYVLNVILADDEEDEEDEEEFIFISQDEIEKKALQDGQAIKEAFIDKDADTLKSVFSVYKRNKYNIIYQAEMAFDLLDGEIVSVGEVEGGYSGGSTSPNYGQYYTEYDGYIYDVITDTGKKYKISFSGVYNDELHKDTVGISFVLIYDISVKPSEFEKYPDSYALIGLNE